MRTGGGCRAVDREISRFPRKERLHMPGSSTTPGRPGARDGAPVRVAFRAPGFGPAIVHDPIIALGRSDQAGVLRSVEKAFAILNGVFEPTLKQFPTLI